MWHSYWETGTFLMMNKLLFRSKLYISLQELELFIHWEVKGLGLFVFFELEVISIKTFYLCGAECEIQSIAINQTINKQWSSIYPSYPDDSRHIFKATICYLICSINTVISCTFCHFTFWAYFSVQFIMLMKSWIQDFFCSNGASQMVWLFILPK